MKKRILLVLLFSLCSLILLQCRSEKPQFKTISYRTYDYKYIFFGMPGNYGLYLQQGDKLFPPIPGLRKYYTEVVSPRDSSVRARFALGLRCPSRESALLKWISRQVYDGVPTFWGEAEDCECPAPVTLDDIASFYCESFKRSHRSGLAEAEQEPDLYTSAAAGLLITDCWEGRNLCTFYKAEWNEWIWSKEYYYTLDTKTGRVLTLDDFVDSSDRERLGRLAILHLEDGSGDRYGVPNHYGDGKEVLSHCDCCAQIDEGLILTFPRGTFASNAYGQYRAVIPYTELKGILKTMPEE